MKNRPPVPITRQLMMDYFMRGATPRKRWRVGMELEKMGRVKNGEGPIPYDGPGPSVRKVLELLREMRGGDPVFEAANLIGLDGRWGTISLEPGGQVEWSSRPKSSLAELRRDQEQHVAAISEVGSRLGIDWLEVGVDPELPVERMTWMPKARYVIMRGYLGERGRLAHRMMTQTASIQCAFDYEDATDWKRKFKAASVLAPLATALFANSERVDGGPSGHRSYRQAIWRETDPDRCGLPAVVFEPDFGLERWLDWMMSVPTLFLHRARGLVPAGGQPFVELLERTGCDAIKNADWETHASTIFTDVRCYTYIEVRTADLQPDDRAFAVPTFWTGILYEDRALDTALELGSVFDDHETWNLAMATAAREGLDGRVGKWSLRDLAGHAVAASVAGLRAGAACVGDPTEDARPVERLAAGHGLQIPA